MNNEPQFTFFLEASFHLFYDDKDRKEILGAYTSTNLYGQGFEQYTSQRLNTSATISSCGSKRPTRMLRNESHSEFLKFLVGWLVGLLFVIWNTQLLSRFLSVSKYIFSSVLFSENNIKII